MTLENLLKKNFRIKRFWKEITSILLLSIVIIFISKPKEEIWHKYVFVTQKGEFEYQLQEAKTLKQKSSGLQNISNLPPNHGMIFFFDGKEKPMFWMKDTYIFLDLIYLDNNMKVLDIKPNQKPLNEEEIKSNHFAQYVIEIPGGDSKHIGLTLGDTVKK